MAPRPGDPLNTAWLYIGRCPPKEGPFGEAARQLNRIAIDRWFSICEAMLETLAEVSKHESGNR